MNRLAAGRDAMIDAIPQDKEVIMTIAQHIAAKAAHEASQQTHAETMRLVAENMLKKGFDEQDITGVTGLDRKVVFELKQVY